MLLADVVSTSAGVTAASGRLTKAALRAGLLRRADGDDIEITVAFLSGGTRQGRIGIGAAAIHAAAQAPAAAGDPSLQLSEVDELFGRIASLRGTGSATGRA